MSKGQEVFDTLRRKQWIGASVAAAYATSSVALYAAWYQNYDLGKFHFFNDNRHWQGIDKIGHFTTAHYLGRVGHHVALWAGYSQKAALNAAWVGTLFLTTVEVMDGFSPAWGFSWADMLANLGGTALFIGQEKYFMRQWIEPKFSYHPTKYAAYRPEMLGTNHLERILKDYNGQTYWLCVNFPRRILPFVQLALGYNAFGMLGATTNRFLQNGVLKDYTKSIERNHRFLLSLDFDWLGFFRDRPILGGIFVFTSFLKTPFPAVFFDKGNGSFGFCPVYF